MTYAHISDYRVAGSQSLEPLTDELAHGTGNVVRVADRVNVLSTGETNLF
jgi:hypothetical protein